MIKIIKMGLYGAHGLELAIHYPQLALNSGKSGVQSA